MGCGQSSGSYDDEGPGKGGQWSEAKVMERRMALEEKMRDSGLVGPDGPETGDQWRAQQQQQQLGGGRLPGGWPVQQPGGSPWGGPPRPTARPRVSRESAPAGGYMPPPQQNNLMREPIQPAQSQQAQKSGLGAAQGPVSQVLESFPAGMSFIFSDQMDRSKQGDKKIIRTQHNEYVMGKKIGRGAQGKVKLVQSTRDGRSYAAKMLMRSALTKRRPGAKGALTPMQLLHREISIMGRLSGPHVTNLYEVIDDPEQKDVYMIMELCGDQLMGGGPTEVRVCSRFVYSFLSSFSLTNERLVCP